MDINWFIFKGRELYGNCPLIDVIGKIGPIKGVLIKNIYVNIIGNNLDPRLLASRINILPYISLVNVGASKILSS